MRHTRRPVQVIGTRRQPIRSLSDWERLGEPQSPSQWRDGHSAKECAKAWLRSGSTALPEEMHRLFASHPSTADLLIQRAYPEVETKLDRFSGKGRFHDVLLEGIAGQRGAVVSIEAKANESFGSSVQDARAAAIKRTARTKTPARIDLLRQALFPEAVSVEDLRYQLLYAVAGTLIEARRRQADLAVLVIHVFAIEGHIVQSKRRRNDSDLDTFLRRLGMSGTPPEGTLASAPAITGGPFIPGNIELLVGKVSCS